MPFFVVLTKVDVTPRDKLQATLDSLEQVLKSIGANKAPLVIRSNDDAITAANNTPMENVVPIFCISSGKHARCIFTEVSLFFFNLHVNYFQ